MKDAGFGGDSNNDLLYSMMFLSVINTVGNFIGLSLSSKHGRRELMLKCTIPMGLALLIMAGAMIINAAGGGGTCKAAILFLFSFSNWMDLHCLPFSLFDVFLHWICITTLDSLWRNISSPFTWYSKLYNYHYKLALQLSTFSSLPCYHKY